MEKDQNFLKEIQKKMKLELIFLSQGKAHRQNLIQHQRFQLMMNIEVEKKEILQQSFVCRWVE